MNKDKIIEILKEFKVYEEVIEAPNQNEGAIDHVKMARHHAMRRIAVRIDSLYPALNRDKVMEILNAHDDTLIDEYGDVWGVIPGDSYDDVADALCSLSLPTLSEGEIFEFQQWLTKKIEGCDELGGMEKEKWAFQQCFKELTKKEL